VWVAVKVESNWCRYKRWRLYNCFHNFLSIVDRLHYFFGFLLVRMNGIGIGFYFPLLDTPVHVLFGYLYVMDLIRLDCRKDARMQYPQRSLTIIMGFSEFYISQFIEIKLI
jgi:hypothetical protein